MQDAHVLDCEPPAMIDGELHVVLASREPGIPEKGWVPAYHFKLRVDGHAEAVGHVHLRVGYTGHITTVAGHIAYGVVSEWRGRRFAARGARMVIDFAHSLGMATIWITCNPDNVASLRTLEILGAERIDEVDVPAGTEMYDRGEYRKVRFRLGR